ncbi:MAG: hypothetical protein IAE93_08575 [Ignavibacteria bacterium]|nr:hypothetical protein [Ignavibacteria bacterium]
MAADKQIIINTVNWLIKENSAAIFAIGEHYVQAASSMPGEIYCEAVSHHYHSGVDIGLESAFIKMGFHLEEAGNYSRRYLSAEAERIADDIVYIFEEIYGSDPATEFEVTEL